MIFSILAVFGENEFFRFLWLIWPDKLNANLSSVKQLNFGVFDVTLGHMATADGSNPQFWTHGSFHSPLD